MQQQAVEGGSLRREMSFVDLVMACLGAIIGSGWLFGVLYAANAAGPAAIVSSLIGGIAVIFIALVYAELSGMLPEAGGIARYPEFTHGPLVGFVGSWGAFLAYASVPAIEAEAVVQYAEHYIPKLTGNTALDFVIEAVLLIIFFAINVYGVKAFAKVNTVITFLKFVAPTLTVIAFLFAVGHWSNYTATSTGGFMPEGSAGILGAVATSGIVFSYLGFRQAVELAGESRNPQRDVPRAIITAVLLAVALYTLLQVVFIAAIPHSALAKGWAGLSLTSPFAQVASIIGLGWLAAILYADAVLSPSGTGLIYLGSTGRVVLGSARNRYLGQLFRRISDAGVPLYAMIATLVASIIFLLPFPTWQSLVGVISSATVFTYMMGPVSLGVLRKHYAEAHRPYRLPAASVLSPIAFVVGTLIIYWTGWATDWKLAVGLLGGVVVYLIASSAGQGVKKIDGAAIRHGAWVIVYIVAMLAMAYFGAHRFGAPFDHGKGLIHYPLDLVVDIVLALVFYYWAVASGRPSTDTEEAIQRAAELRRQTAAGGSAAMSG
ncbi:amino acid permease-associated region [Acidimicrobium ferrooxidans DSM 10331]|uniref:Amino acid permease-associated region n=2 Tax=Acidimicrobium ferrooxidans TaxID=53635 RepID=C7LYS9_ACIFD|nr:amino acid permease-associated region [Acidimicrobium ferrooxidans DSM 10331]